MKEIKARLIKRISRTPTVESFRFLLTEKIDFIPGQFLKVIFDEANRDNKELNKYLSFSSSATREYIEVTKRLSNSVFSQTLNSLEINDEVLLKAPLGTCVFKEEYQKIGFLIGGIGITPVISIIEYIVDKKLDTDVALFYSNRTEEEVAFKEELDSWQNRSKNIKVFYTLTESQPQDSNFIPTPQNRPDVTSGQDGGGSGFRPTRNLGLKPGLGFIFGRIDKNLLLKENADYKERIFFIFGPPKMVEVMDALCFDSGCLKENIRTESFVGY